MIGRRNGCKIGNDFIGVHLESSSLRMRVKLLNESETEKDDRKENHSTLTIPNYLCLV